MEFKLKDFPKIITKKVLENGDEITIGEVTLKFVIEEEKKSGKVYVID